MIKRLVKKDLVLSMTRSKDWESFVESDNMAQRVWVGVAFKVSLITMVLTSSISAKLD